MIIQAKFAALRGIRLHEYAIRFIFGGLVCVAAGLVAKRFGPGVGGLFLAFPAIFPAGASMVDAHERKHKARVGIDGTNRGRVVAGIDAAGTAIGCVGLVGFAVTCWLFLPRLASCAVFALATFAWLAVSMIFWLLLKSRIFRKMHKPSHRPLAFRKS
jgi:hypothetical protein